MTKHLGTVGRKNSSHLLQSFGDEGRVTGPFGTIMNQTFIELYKTVYLDIFLVVRSNISIYYVNTKEELKLVLQLNNITIFFSSCPEASSRSPS